MTLDIDRLSDWLRAVERWHAGDARPIAQFVLRWGIDSEVERAELARMLTTRPDARRAVKASTQAVLRDVERAIRRRTELLRELGLTRRQVYTNADIYAAVAGRHGLKPESVERAWKRHRR